MATIGTKALERLVDLSDLTVQEKAAAKTTLRALRDDYNDRRGGAAPTPPAPPPPVITPSVFDGAGVFVYDWTSFDAAAAARARQSGFRWIAGLEHEGTSAPVPKGHVSDVQVAGWRDSGMTVGCYGYCKGDPRAVAEAASGIITQRGYRFYIANAEADVPKDFDRAFLARFRELQPALPLGLSTNPDDPRDWQAWRTAGATPMFQAYLNVNPAVTPLECEYKSLQHGFPAAAQKPTVGLYPPKTVAASTYVAELARTGVRGFSVYLGEHLTGADWLTFAAGIRDEHIAV